MRDITRPAAELGTTPTYLFNTQNQTVMTYTVLVIYKIPQKQYPFRNTYKNLFWDFDNKEQAFAKAAHWCQKLHLGEMKNIENLFLMASNSNCRVELGWY